MLVGSMNVNFVAHEIPGSWFGSRENAHEAVLAARDYMDVPEDHYIDGIPAYAQCGESENSAIWSNNGINTRLE